MKRRELMDPKPQKITSTTDFLLASLWGGGRSTQRDSLSFAASIPCLTTTQISARYMKKADAI